MTRGAAALAVGYFGYFAALGIFQPYWPLQLAALGIPAAGIGALLALVGAVRIAGPLGTAWLADHVADRRPLIIGLGIGAAAAALALGLAQGVGAMAAALVAYSLAVNGLMPVYDAHALERLGAAAHRYGTLRLWGSVGFIASSTLVGAAVGRHGVGVVPVALGATLAATALAYLALPPSAPRPPAARLGLAGFAAAVAAPPVPWFLTVCFLQQASFGGYYGFYTLYLHEYGYGAATIGLYWAFGVLAEVAMFALGARLLARFPLAALLQVALAGTAARWLLVAAFPELPAVMLGAQALHLLGFGLFHSVTVLLGPQLLPAGSGARAQALVSSLGWGGGGVAGSLLAGVLWGTAGSRAVFLASAALALAGLGVAGGGRLSPRA